MATGDRLGCACHRRCRHVGAGGLRNQRQMGSPVIIATNMGFNLWMGHHEGASGRMNVAGDLLPVADDPDLSAPNWRLRRATSSCAGLAIHAHAPER